MNLRRFLYRLASLLGDLNAARRSKLGQRLIRRTVYRQANRAARRLTRGLR
jgi:hypothetical protein